MGQLIRAGAITLAIFGSVSFAAAQTSPNLTPNQERMVSRGLAASPSEAAPVGAQPQVGTKLPESMTGQALPKNVTDQVPEAKELFFVKLPDRIILIDPDTKLVTEIITEQATTGASPGSTNQPSK
jgi:hypothetical protein